MMEVDWDLKPFTYLFTYFAKNTSFLVIQRREHQQQQQNVYVVGGGGGGGGGGGVRRGIGGAGKRD